MKPNRTPDGYERFRHHAVLPRFTDAFRGIYMAYREEPNLRFHVFAAACAAVAAVAVGLAPWEIAYLSATVMSVIFAEMVNTAVERTVDLAAAGQRHPLAGLAKEVAAGAVLVAALHAVFAAGFLFLYNRGIAETVGALWHLALERPWWVLLPVAAGVMGLFGGVREPHG